MVAVTLASGWAVHAQGGISRVAASLRPWHEVPSVSSPARGSFSARINTSTDTVEYRLTYSGLQANITQAHIHFAQFNVNGGIMVWLCQTPATPQAPAGIQLCPQSGTITGVIQPANVLAITPQGIAAGDFDEFVSALRTGLAYVNVHTAQSTGGEIRGQVLPGLGHR
jgi:hypothetical protein